MRGKNAKVGAGDTAILSSNEADWETIGLCGPTWRSPALRGFIAQRPVDRRVMRLGYFHSLRPRLGRQQY